MLYLISYDIPSGREGDNRRARLARYLLGIGLRVQYSIFEVEMPPEKLPLIQEEIESVIDLEQDNVRVYPICGSCRGRFLRLGVEAVIEYTPLMIW